MPLSEFLNKAENLLVITGAGCSTASGIGDYRDTSGAWKRAQPVQHQDFMNTLSWRKRYWARSQLGFPQFLKAQPNAAHLALAELERRADLCGLITQNVDRLHQRAGHQQVLDLHGRLDQVVCMSCQRVTTRAAWQTWLEQQNPTLAEVAFAAAPDGDADLKTNDFAAIKVPDCLDCGGILKPNVVFYGDSVPKPTVDQAYQWVDQADAVLVVGSSLMVYSSFRFVRRAHQRGIPIVAVNRGKTRADDCLTLKVDDDCGQVLQAYMQAQT